MKITLTEEEKLLILKQEREKHKGTSMEVELDYHDSTFIYGIEAAIEYLNNKNETH